MGKEMEKHLREGDGSAAFAALVFCLRFSDFSVSTFFCHNLFLFGYYVA